MNTRMGLLACTVLGMLAGASWAAAPVDYAAEIDRLMPGMGAKAIPDRKDAQTAFEKLCHEAAAPGQDARRQALSKAIVARLGPDTPKPARVWMLRRIDTIGADEAVAGLAALLKDSDVEIRDLARRALANNPSPKAAAVLRDELNAATDPDWQVALINALGYRRDGASVSALTRLAGNRSAPVALAAVAALADVGDVASARSLAVMRKIGEPALRGAVLDASLRLAKNLQNSGRMSEAAEIYQQLLDERAPEHVQIAVYTGLAATMGDKAVPQLLKLVSGDDGRMQLIAARCLENMGKDATPAIVKAMESAEPDAKAMLLDVLGRRGDPAALKSVARQVEADQEPVGLAALDAIGRIGDDSVVTLLIQRGARSQGAERDAARRALASLPDKDVDAKVLAALEGAKGAERVEYIQAVWGRRITPARPTILKAAREDDAAVRLAALTAMERLARTEDLGALLDLLVDARADDERKAAEEAIASTCRRAGDDDKCSDAIAAAMDKASVPGKVVLLRLLGNLQADAALPVVRGAARSGDAAVREAAVAALKKWKPIRITTWAFSGPYTRDGKGAQDLFNVAFAPEESHGAAEWKPFRLNKKEERAGTLDLHKVGKGDNRCAYLRTTIRSEKAQDVVLTLGSDDGVKVWLNGRPIHEKNVTRGLNCDEDQAKASLKEGENVLLVKVTQGGSDWSFCCAIRAAEGGPADGLAFEAK